MGSDWGCDDRDHRKEGWPPRSSVFLSEFGFDGHQDQPVRPVLQPSYRHWGVVVINWQGRPPRLGGFFAATALIACIAVLLIVIGAVSYELGHLHDPRPVVERHTPSDLDKGSAPPSWERYGKAGPQGLKGTRSGRLQPSVGAR